MINGVITKCAECHEGYHFKLKKKFLSLQLSNYKNHYNIISGLQSQFMATRVIKKNVAFKSVYGDMPHKKNCEFYEGWCYNLVH